MLYTIFERTPFPGYFRPLSAYALLRAEMALKLNQHNYPEHARKVGTVLTYSWDDAQRIIDYWRTIHPAAEYQLLADVGSI
jgi:hypothetical protein